MTKCLAKASACFCIEFSPFSLQHKDRSQRKKNLSSALYITQAGTANYISSLWEEILFIGLSGPILHLLTVFGCQLREAWLPLPYWSQHFSAQSSTTLPQVSIPNPDTSPLSSPMSVFNCHSILHANLMHVFVFAIKLCTNRMNQSKTKKT